MPQRCVVELGWESGAVRQPVARLDRQKEPQVQRAQKLVEVVRTIFEAVRILASEEVLDHGRVPRHHPGRRGEYPPTDDCEESRCDDASHRDGMGPYRRQVSKQIQGLGKARVPQRRQEDDTSKEGPEIKEEEVLVIPPADAVPRPRTMMVHSEHADAAAAAMVRTLGTWHLAMRAHLRLSWRPAAGGLSIVLGNVMGHTAPLDPLRALESSRVRQRSS